MNQMEASRRWDVSQSVISGWIKKGLIQAEKHKSPNGYYFYSIPDDTPCPPFIKRCTRSPGRYKTYATQTKEESDVIPKEHHMQYIWQKQNHMTIGQLKSKLGISHREVSSLYDQAYTSRQWPFPTENTEGGIQCSNVNDTENTETTSASYTALKAIRA